MSSPSPPVRRRSSGDSGMLILFHSMHVRSQLNAAIFGKANWFCRVRKDVAVHHGTWRTYNLELKFSVVMFRERTYLYVVLRAVTCFSIYIFIYRRLLRTVVSSLPTRFVVGLRRPLFLSRVSSAATLQEMRKTIISLYYQRANDRVGPCIDWYFKTFRSSFSFGWEAIQLQISVFHFFVTLFIVVTLLLL